jgi:hypothetical protein
MGSSQLATWLTFVSVLITGWVARPLRAEDAPVAEVPPEINEVLQDRKSAAAEVTAPHEVYRPPAKAASKEYIHKDPPRDIATRPGARPPGANYQWIDGYWEWDAARKDFVWVTGIWYAPPAGTFWVSGYWRRDPKGWFRVPGQWSGRRGPKLDWRQTGPPNDRVEESIGPAPGPDYFYVPGQYVPERDELVWKPGFWYRSQPGWEWSPARWVKQSSGWAFRPGRWNRDGTLVKPLNDSAETGEAVADNAADNATSLTPTSAVVRLTNGDPQPSDGADANANANPPLTVEALPDDAEKDPSKADGDGDSESAKKKKTKPAPAPTTTYAPRTYSPYTYPRGYYYGGNLRSFVPMARGFLRQFIP